MVPRASSRPARAAVADVSRTIGRVALLLHRLGALLTVLMMALVCYDVLARQLFGAPFQGTAELVATALALVVFLQTPHVMIERRLLRVSVLFDALGPVGRSVLNTLAWSAGTLMFGALVVTSWEPMIQGLVTSEFYGMDAFRIPAWPLRIGTFVLWVIATGVCLYLAIESLRGRMTAAEGQLPE